MSETKENLSLRIKNIFNYGFGTYTGLITFIIAYLILVILFLGSFSEPVEKILGFSLINIDLSEETRVGRIIMLYHSIAMPFLAAVVFFILDLFPIRKRAESHVKWPLFYGSMLTSVSGLTYAYIFQENMILHGLFVVGLSLVWYSGMAFVIGVWPTKSFPESKEGPIIGKINLENLNLVLVGLSLIVTATLGAIVGANFGNPDSALNFEAFIAEARVRIDHSGFTPEAVYVRMIVAHLHIMLALIDAAILLIAFKFTKTKGKWYLVAQIAIIPGILITDAGGWLVPADVESAHMIINVGVSILILASIVLIVDGFRKVSKKVLGEKYDEAPFYKKFLAIFKDSVLSGLYFLFIWVNLVVTVPGIYIALNLDEVRAGPFELEYAYNVGHWHVLATLSAMMILLMYIDSIRIKKKWIREILGWGITIGSTFAFGFVMFYMLKWPDMSAWYMYLTDVGIVLILTAIGIFCVYQLVKIIQSKVYKEKISIDLEE
ncbi:MAG: hypothetical protein ACTSQ6_10540 [Candidatus Heimdallarchaeaceae archaeon]